MKTLRKWLVRLVIVASPFALILFGAALGNAIEGTNFHDALTFYLAFALLLVMGLVASEYQPARVRAR